MLRKVQFLILSIIIAVVLPASAATTTENILEEPVITYMDMSPSGEHLVGVGREYFQFMSTDTLQMTSPAINVDRNQREHMAGTWWANDDRLLYTVEMTVDPSDFPWWPNNFYSVETDGKRHSAPFNRGRDDRDIALTFVDRFDANDRVVLMQEKKFRDFRVVAESTPSILQFDFTAKRKGKRTKRQRGPVSYGDLFVDRDGIARVSIGRPLSEGGLPTMHYRANADGEWRDITAETGISQAGVTIRFIGFDVENRSFYLLSDHGPGGIVSLWQFSPDDKSYEQVYGDDEFDISDAQWTGDRTEILGVILHDHFSTFVPLARQHRNTVYWNTLRKQQVFSPFRTTVAGASRDGTKLLLFVNSSTHPGAYWLFDNNQPSQRKLRMVSKTRPSIDVAAMSETQTYAVKTDDGLQLFVYLTVPKNADGPVPLIVLPHDGPINVNDSYGFNPIVQTYALNGYAVVQVNYRGSDGRGRLFESRGYQEWHRKIVDDVILTTRFAASQSSIDGSRICIAGDRYGAFIALAATTREPDLYKCAIGNQGLYDLARMWSGGRSTWILVPPEILRIILGDDLEALAAASPTNNADKIKVPVFLSHGGKDGWAPTFQHRLMVNALRNADVKFDVMDEIATNHGFRLAEDQTRLYKEILSFVKKHI